MASSFQKMTRVKAGVEDVISGMEVISIDDPINTIPSDSLINGELLSNPNPFNNPSSSKLVPASLVTKEGRSTVAPVPIVSTEKPVSIIERIIYSITAISTASPDKTIDITNDGPTKPTAIFKIPSKTQKEDVTIDTLAGQHGLETVTLNEIKPLTTETPTTIIERILSSISAIQASSTTTERTDTQVGNSLNTISTTFKPLSSNKRVSATVSTTLSTTTLSPSSTPQDALDVIEQISSERSLQQRTISRLLELLKSISPNATPVPEKVVVVTPKITSFTSATSVGDLNREVEVFNTTSSSVESRIAATTVADLPLETLAPTTPDLLQNTIAGIESTTNLPTSSGNTKLPDTISISDFLATLDTLNGVESTTGNQRIIESTTPTSLTNESTTVSANSAATTAADKAELIAVTTVTPTTVESANLVTVVTEAATPTTELVTTTLGTAQFENLETLDGATEGGGDNTTPPVTLAARIELGTESVVTSTTPEESTESQPPVITTEMPSTTATSAQQEITTPLPSESSNTIPPGADPSSILNMLSRLLEISGRTQVLNTITLEQTTISSSTDSSTLTDGTSTSAPISTTANFAVSPGSVTIFSANDLNSMFTPTDDGTTVTILSRSFLTTSPPTSTESSFTETNAITPSSSPDNSSAAIVTMGPADKSADLISTTPLSAPTSNDTADTITTTIPPDESADLVVSTLAPTENSDAVMTTTIMENLTGNIDSTTQIPMTETSTESMLPTTTITAEVTTIIESSSSNNTMDVSNATNSTMQGSANTTVSDRAGRLLIIESEPVQNDLQVSSEPPEKDYFIFGILSNNTILRKRPSKYPNKRTPFVIVGVYPNNTVIQKFPNGTLIPEEPVIQGDIRSNPPSNDASQPITTIAPAVVTFSAPPTVTMSTLTATTSGNAAMARETVTPKVGDRNRDVEEVNIEENTISNNKPEKIVEQTTTIRGPQRSRQRTTTPRGVTTTQTAKPAVTELPTTQEPTTILAAIRIEDLVEDETTLPSIMETTIAPKLSNRFRTTTSPPELTTRRAFTTPRYTNTITTVVPSFENLQLTIRPTTPYLIQRIIGNITGTAVRLGGEPTTNIPLSTTTTSTEIPIETSTIPPTIRSRVRIPTTTIPQALTTPIPTMTTELLTTTDAALTATSRSRGRSRYSLSTPFEALVRTVTVTPSTVSTDAPSTTDFPFRTTFTPRRYTQTPTTINIPSRIAMFTPTTVFANVPTATEQNFMSTTSFNSQNADLEGSTVFPVFTTTFEEVTETQPPPPPSAPDTTTSTPPTFASTQRQRQRTTTPLTAMTSTNLQRLAELRLSENFGELSTTGDYFTPTTVVPTITSTTAASSLQTTLKTITTKVKQLTEQQKKDLEELAKLEQEQQQILQQLAFLTRLNLGGGGPKPTRSPSNLAGRVVDFAAERNKQASTENPSAANLLETLTNQNSKPLETKPLSLEDILKQLNVNPNSVTLSPSSSSYGQSTDAILAALLKQQGIEPNTPKALGDQLKTTTAVPRTTTTRRAPATRRRTTTTTPRPGPIMQGLNWLLNALAPAPTTKKPATRKKAPASSTSSSRNQPFRQEIELLSSQPTEYTPVVYTVPPRTRSTPSQSRQSSRFRKPLHSLSETELRNLVIQLETAQRDPSKAKDIDFASLGFQESTEKATTLLADNAVQITNSGRVGSNSKIRQTPDSSATEAGVVPLVYRRGRYTTPVSSGVSNSILDDEEEEPTTTRSRKVSLPPVQLNPIPGIDGEGGTQVRGQLINAAVNVTRAISQFLGSAIQDAAYQITNLFSNGDGNIRNAIAANSALPTINIPVNVTSR
ncbi:hypothetical protein QE152_g6391 [Popillia japonica]|uniref:Uncharacterized protein n=1 Tax=Popillia japonica TaxID=7064 RepID=A0AAW1MH83_POPJA